MTSRPNTSLQYGCWTGTDANLSADSLIEGTGVLPVYYRQDRCTTGVLQTGQVYHQYTTDRTGIQTVQVYRQYRHTDSTVQVYGTVQEVCIVQVYREYRFTRQVYYWCSTDSTGAGEELTLITQLGLSYIEDRCRTGALDRCTGQV